jgi:spore germination protein YaaH
MFIKTRFILFFICTVFGCILIATPSLANKNDTATVKPKSPSAFKADLKKIEKALSFLNFFHHDDSTKLAKQFIHEQHQLTKGRKGYPYNVKHSEVPIKVEAYKSDSTFKLDYEVFGWYPYWEDSLYQHLNYSLITTLAYFSYEVNPTSGKPTTTHNWNTTPLIDSAHAHHTNVLLTVTNFGQANNKQFLTNTNSIQTFISEITALLKLRSGNGVCVDFEGIGNAQKEDFSKFLTLLNQSLKKENKDYKLYITVPAVDWAKYLDMEVLIPVVDQFVIMGYGYYGSTSKVAGPVAPLHSEKKWEPYNLTTSVDYYLANQIPASKLILALPYYGIIWETESGVAGSKVKSFIGNRTYDYIETNINAPIQYDTISQSAWYSYVVNSDNSEYRQCWFNNDSTLSIKLDYIKSKNLNGMGIWALGYDKGYNNMWEVIANDFCNTGIISDSGIIHIVDSLNTDSIASVSNFIKEVVHIESLLQTVTNYKTVLLYTLSFVVFFGGMGLVISMFQPNTRMFFFGNTAYTIYYVSTILLFLIVILRWTNIITDYTILFITGFISGGVAMFIAYNIIKKIDNNRP